MPAGHAIGAAKLRGVDSHGMLCSAKELALSEDATGLLVLPGDAEPGTPLARVLGIEDVVLEVNRKGVESVGELKSALEKQKRDGAVDLLVKRTNAGVVVIHLA